MNVTDLLSVFSGSPSGLTVPVIGSIVVNMHLYSKQHKLHDYVHFKITIINLMTSTAKVDSTSQPSILCGRQNEYQLSGWEYSSLQ